MPRFREKHAEIEAVQFDPATKPWPKGVTPRVASAAVLADTPGDYLLDDILLLNPGDWIVEARSGQREVCDTTTLEATYEQINE